MSTFRSICGLLAASLIWGVIPLVCAAASAPEVLLSLSGPVRGELESGEPLFVSVRIEAPEEGAKFVLAPATGGWQGAVAVELTSAAAGGTTLQATPVAPAAESSPLTLDTEQSAEGMWLFSSAGIARLPMGSYRVQVRLVILNGAGWKGTATSEESELKIVPAAATPSRERLDRRAVVLASEAMATDGFSQAARLLDQRLVVDPDNVELLKARALLCVRGGNFPAANACVNRAWTRVMREQWSHPPQDLYLLSQTIAQAVLSGAASEGGPLPEWSVPPANVLEPIREGKSTPVAPATATMPTTVATQSGQRASSTPTAGVSSSGLLVPPAELIDAKIIADTAGQWAASAVASSQYGKTQYSATQATGTPNISVAGNSPDAWCPANKSNGTDWLEVTFAKPVHALEVRVRQNDTVGAIMKIEAIEPGGTVHLWWEGSDPYVPSAVREIVWFGVRVPKTAYLVSKVKITLNLAAMPGWKQIDAVQLVGAPD